MTPRVTALVAVPRGGVRVDLDGEPWRTLPAGAVIGAGLAAGVDLDRQRARLLNRSLRRERALAAATRTLGRRDRSSAELAAHLDRRGVRAVDRDAAVCALESAGYLDDARFATQRAALVAMRGYGDEAVRADLERHGVGSAARGAAMAALEPESERARAIVERLGATPRTAAKLARGGFSHESIEAVFAGLLPLD